jgi:nucleotide-binding universal stress UspA family protein
VSDQVAQHAPCPVVVVREPANPAQDRVVVGVDGSADAQRAIGFAFDIAARNNAPLTALYGWPERRPGTVSARSPRLGAIGERIDAGERLLAESLAGWAEKYPDVSVIGEAVPVRPARLLVDASEQAALVVVGSRGRGGFAALLLGSVSRAVLHHARCAVAVVH